MEYFIYRFIALSILRGSGRVFKDFYVVRNRVLWDVCDECKGVVARLVGFLFTCGGV